MAWGFGFDSNKNRDDKELELDSANPEFTFQYDDKNTGLAGQQLYNEKSVVYFDTHFNGLSRETRTTRPIDAKL